MALTCVKVIIEGLRTNKIYKETKQMTRKEFLNSRSHSRACIEWQLEHEQPPLFHAKEWRLKTGKSLNAYIDQHPKTPITKLGESFKYL